MSGLKPLLLVLCFLSGPAIAGDRPLMAAFATCAGRLSAELEHAWLMRDAGSARIEDRRRHFLSLLDATVPAGRQRDALDLRIRAKAAHAALLAQASFATRADHAQWAQRRARLEITSCAGYLLES
ncbi:hypothetical protein ILP92_13585 [Maribius pontilimi]|uniref:Lysozyme inhibitor LprI N-terminal domain-containing protein n=1 Tax=Palleronia pontilimi TaxID=1964209 RepID=A0A934IKQ9_9RHOB|nr:hypothetical protein [Palleronia pontilimi]MBJ3763784.1 hypothetical protein [Palleronia pontilimi]